jgi:hypothetical protein
MNTKQVRRGCYDESLLGRYGLLLGSDVLRKTCLEQRIGECNTVGALD